VKLLIIRPQPGADASAARARAAGFEPIVIPFFEIRPRPWALADANRYDALLLTSSNAVRHAGAGLSTLLQLPVHVVGQRTAEIAQAAGLRIASIGTSDANEAVAAAMRAGHHNLLWLAGQDHRDFANTHGMTITPMICYASDAVALPDNARAQIVAADAVALHSARAALRFRRAVMDYGLDPAMITIAAFSAAIAEAAGDGWRAILVADMADDSSLLSALQSLGR
jgi:uroporphyrinogen-III synthase